MNKPEETLVDELVGDDPPALGELAEWITELIIDAVLFLQQIMPGVAMLGLVTAALLIFVGALTGSRGLRGAGFAGLLGTMLMYLITMNAPLIIAYLESLFDKGG